MRPTGVTSRVVQVLSHAKALVLRRPSPEQTKAIRRIAEAAGTYPYGGLLPPQIPEGAGTDRLGVLLPPQAREGDGAHELDRG